MKSRNISKNKVKALGTMAFLTFASNAHATCDIAASSVITGSTVNCTGTTTGLYRIATGNVDNVSVKNTGDWTYNFVSGDASTGTTPSHYAYIGLTGTGSDSMTFTNSGKIIGNNLLAPDVLSSTRSFLSAGIQVRQNDGKNNKFYNTSSGIIEAKVTAGIGFVLGISAGGVGNSSGDSLIDNAGTVTISSSTGSVRGLVTAGTGSKIINSGTVNATTTSSGRTETLGILVEGHRVNSGIAKPSVDQLIDNSGTVNISGSTLASTGIQAAYETGVGGVVTSLNTTINNSGTVLVNTNVSNSTVYGIAMKGSSNNSTVNNSGKITLTGGNSILRGTYAGIYRSNGGTNGSEMFTINNTGDITTDAMSYAIYTLNTRDTVNIDGGNILGNIGTGIANDTLTLTNGSIVGNIDTGINEDIFVATGGSIKGSLNMNFGSDTATISNIDLSTIPTLDGGDDTLVADGFIDTLTLSNTSVATTELLNWEKIVLDATTFASPNNTLSTGTDPGYGLFLTNGSLLNAGTAFNLTGNLDIDSTSTFQGYGAGSGVYAVSGSVTNAGTITTQDGAAGDVITVGGDYTGVSGSTYKIDTVLGNDSSITDNLAITGNASGATAINVANVGGTGAQTTEGIKVIDVAGTSGATFTLASAVQAGADEYSLFKNGVTDPIDGDWYLRSTLIPTPTEPATPIYRPGTSNYVSAQTANAEQGFLALGTLHERMNEQQVVSTDKQTWVRYYGNTESNNGDSRFNYNQHISAVQVGQDLYNKTTTNGTDVHSGIMFDYSNSEVDFADRVREAALLDNTTGNLEARSYGLGGYYTAINGDESYLDVVGMVSKLDNKFEDSYGMKSTQDGYRLGLSVETGKKLVELGKWKVEGQGQLAYQYTNYDNFNDDISGIDGYGASTLRGRLGVRVYRHLESTKEMKQIDNAQVYGVANVIQDFINPTDVTVGGTNVSEKFDKTTLEVGGGFQVPVSGTTYVYTDARYDRSIKGNKEQGKLTIGFKTQF